ncbi:sensory neuron membrane protein 1-like [Nilaparvata lugens]|uniref:sensory neuron membrane protein 1-like n=1 Tax=Nilaparvata lugens TaxID=108931 RepID=UPI00193DB964|nr:sensory neuron membrane protein 1-like [Nilaparvata lugens]
MTSCYCSRPKKCPPGAVDITPCLGAPLTATFPHFFDAPEFQNDVIGLNPDRAKHSTYGILQEASGVPLRGRRRVQISIELKKIPYVGVTSKLKGYMCPLLWIEEAFDLEGDLLSMVKYQLVLGLTAMSAVKWGLLILGAGLSIFGGVGKFMNGPNWKKMGRENSPQNPPDLPTVEDGSNKRYRNLQDPKMEQQSRSIMFYKEKFRKADSSIQTEPLFFAVENGRNLQPQKVNIEDRPTHKFGHDPSQTIIPCIVLRLNLIINHNQY